MKFRIYATDMDVGGKLSKQLEMCLNKPIRVEFYVVQFYFILLYNIGNEYEMTSFKCYRFKSYLATIDA